MSLADQIRAQAKPDGDIQHHRLHRARSPSMLSLALKQLLRGVREWGYGSKLYRLRLKGRHPVQLLASPDDPAPGNGSLGRALVGGDFRFEDERLDISDGFWAELYAKSPAFFAHAHRFNFLEDLASVPDQSSARETAEFLMRLWLEDYSNWDKTVWDVEILARRQISWCAHAPLVLWSNDLVYKSSVLLTMAHQARHLMRTLKDSRCGLGEIYSGAALILSGLVLPYGAQWLRVGEDYLGRAVTGFIKADGGPLTGSPADAVKVMQQLVMVRSAYQEVDCEQPAWVQATLDKLGPFVRAMRLPDGSLAAFGGTSSRGGRSMETAHGVEAILQASGAEGRAMESAPLSGFQRISSGKTVIVMDTGPAPAPHLSGKAGASTGALEMADGQQKIIISMGPAGTRTAMPDLAPLSRTSAAFSNHVVSNRNVSRLLDSGLIGKGVTETVFHRQLYDGGAVELYLSHDGYLKRFGLWVERRVNLSVDGTTLKGHEKWAADKIKKASKESGEIRFHLHPSVNPVMLDDGRIRLEAGQSTWLFSVINAAASLEGSLHMETPASFNSTQQIVLAATAEQLMGEGVRWRLSKELDSEA